MTPVFDITDWQLFVYILFSLLIIFSAWQGWQHGMGRSILILVGVGIGYLAGKTLGFIIFDLYESIISYPRPLVELITNIIFGVLVYFLFVAASIFMFKSTRKQPGAKEKLISGIGGVVFGICNGLIVAIVIAIGIRLMGIANMVVPPEPGSIEFLQKQDVFLPEHLKENAKISVNLSRAILNPPLRKWVELTNPVSEKYYKLLLNLKVLSKRKDLLKQFIENEEVQNLLHTPEVTVVIENSKIPQLLEQGNFYALIRNESFIELYRRESCAALLNNMNWTLITSQIIENSDLANHPDL
jgi:hypothetical protein